MWISKRCSTGLAKEQAKQNVIQKTITIRGESSQNVSVKEGNPWDPYTVGDKPKVEHVVFPEADYGDDEASDPNVKDEKSDDDEPPPPAAGGDAVPSSYTCDQCVNYIPQGMSCPFCMDAQAIEFGDFEQPGEALQLLVKQETEVSCGGYATVECEACGYKQIHGQRTCAVCYKLLPAGLTSTQKREQIAKAQRKMVELVIL